MADDISFDVLSENEILVSSVDCVYLVILKLIHGNSGMQSESRDCKMDKRFQR